jgi:hypothetical protein
MTFRRMRLVNSPFYLLHFLSCSLYFFFFWQQFPLIFRILLKRTRQEVEKIKRGINQSHSSESHSPPQYRYGATRPDDQNRKSHLVNGNTDQIDPHSKNTTKRVNRSPQLKHNSPIYNRKINGLLYPLPYLLYLMN